LLFENASPNLDIVRAAALRQRQYGATLGGPIKKDSAFYFVNYEGQRRDESNRFPRVVQQNLAGINAFRLTRGSNAVHLPVASATVELSQSQDSNPGSIVADATGQYFNAHSAR
jgi:hypothetical protein